MVVLAAGDVVVDGAGDADAGDALVGQRAGAHKRTVAADDDQRVDAELLAAGQTFGLAFVGLELKAARGVKDGAAAVDDLRNAAHVHLVHFAVDQAVVAALDAHHPVAFGDAGAHDGAHGGVHAGGVAAAGQHADGLDLLGHCFPSRGGQARCVRTRCAAVFPHISVKQRPFPPAAGRALLKA